MRFLVCALLCAWAVTVAQDFFVKPMGPRFLSPFHVSMPPSCQPTAQSVHLLLFCVTDLHRNDLGQSILRWKNISQSLSGESTFVHVVSDRRCRSDLHYLWASHVEADVAVSELCPIIHDFDHVCSYFRLKVEPRRRADGGPVESEDELPLRAERCRLELQNLKSYFLEEASYLVDPPAALVSAPLHVPGMTAAGLAALAGAADDFARDQAVGVHLESVEPDVSVVCCDTQWHNMPLNLRLRCRYATDVLVISLSALRRLGPVLDELGDAILALPLEADYFNALWQRFASLLYVYPAHLIRASAGLWRPRDPPPPPHPHAGCGGGDDGLAPAAEWGSCEELALVHQPEPALAAERGPWCPLVSSPAAGAVQWIESEGRFCPAVLEDEASRRALLEAEETHQRHPSPQEEEQQEQGKEDGDRPFIAVVDDGLAGLCAAFRLTELRYDNWALVSAAGDETAAAAAARPWQLVPEQECPGAEGGGGRGGGGAGGNIGNSYFSRLLDLLWPAAADWRLDSLAEEVWDESLAWPWREQPEDQQQATGGGGSGGSEPGSMCEEIHAFTEDGDGPRGGERMLRFYLAKAAGNYSRSHCTAPIGGGRLSHGGMPYEFRGYVRRLIRGGPEGPGGDMSVWSPLRSLLDADKVWTTGAPHMSLHSIDGARRVLYVESGGELFQGRYDILLSAMPAEALASLVRRGTTATPRDSSAAAAAVIIDGDLREEDYHKGWPQPSADLIVVEVLVHGVCPRHRLGEASAAYRGGLAGGGPAVSSFLFPSKRTVFHRLFIDRNPIVPSDVDTTEFTAGGDSAYPRSFFSFAAEIASLPPLSALVPLDQEALAEAVLSSLARVGLYDPALLAHRVVRVLPARKERVAAAAARGPSWSSLLGASPLPRESGFERRKAKAAAAGIRLLAAYEMPPSWDPRHSEAVCMAGVRMVDGLLLRQAAKRASAGPEDSGQPEGGRGDDAAGPPEPVASVHGDNSSDAHRDRDSDVAEHAPRASWPAPFSVGLSTHTRLHPPFAACESARSRGRLMQDSGGGGGDDEYRTDGTLLTFSSARARREHRERSRREAESRRARDEESSRALWEHLAVRRAGGGFLVTSFNVAPDPREPLGGGGAGSADRRSSNQSEASAAAAEAAISTAACRRFLLRRASDLARRTSDGLLHVVRPPLHVAQALVQRLHPSAVALLAHLTYLVAHYDALPHVVLFSEPDLPTDFWFLGRDEAVIPSDWLPGIMDVTRDLGVYSDLFEPVTPAAASFSPGLLDAGRRSSFSGWLDQCASSSSARPLLCAVKPFFFHAPRALLRLVERRRWAQWRDEVQRAASNHSSTADSGDSQSTPPGFSSGFLVALVQSLREAAHERCASRHLRRGPQEEQEQGEESDDLCCELWLRHCDSSSFSASGSDSSLAQLRVYPLLLDASREIASQELLQRIFGDHMSSWALPALRREDGHLLRQRALTVYVYDMPPALHRSFMDIGSTILCWQDTPWDRSPCAFLHSPHRSPWPRQTISCRDSSWPPPPDGGSRARPRQCSLQPLPADLAQRYGSSFHLSAYRTMDPSTDAITLMRLVLSTRHMTLSLDAARADLFLIPYLASSTTFMARNIRSHPPLFDGNRRACCRPRLLIVYCIDRPCPAVLPAGAAGASNRPDAGQARVPVHLRVHRVHARLARLHLLLGPRGEVRVGLADLRAARARQRLPRPAEDVSGAAPQGSPEPLHRAVLPAGRRPAAGPRGGRRPGPSARGGATGSRPAAARFQWQRRERVAAVAPGAAEDILDGVRVVSQ
jgi:hypothetical protein